MSQVKPLSTPGIPGLLVLCAAVLLLLPAGADARESRGQQRGVHEQSRATEVLRAGNELGRGEVRVIRGEASGREAYAYKMNGRERVSIVAPRRVERQTQRVHRPSRRVDEIAHSRLHRQAEIAAAQEHRVAEALQDAAASEQATVLPVVHRPSARERAEAAVHGASRHHHRLHRDVHRKTYAGYDHTPRSRASASLHYKAGPKHHRHPTKLIRRSHRYRDHVWYDLPVSVRHHYHFSSRHRHHFGTSLGVHLGSRRSYCLPPRLHHRSHFRSHHRKGGSVSIYLGF